MKRRLVLPVILFLNACVPVTPTAIPTRANISDSSLPPMKFFGPATPSPIQRSNADIARDFLDLSFKLESGRELPVLTRFEGPITLHVMGNVPPSLEPDLRRLLTRLRTEARIDVTPTASDDAAITIQAVTRTQIRSVLPQAACFVAPNVSSLSEYRSARRQPRTNWTLLETRTRIAIFIPSDSSPQEVRDCLHEELAQALGPLNDLYRLPDTVFNDDNVHTVLTSFDMLILRITYSSDLGSGMSREQVAARLPRILARLNPAGEQRGASVVSETPQDWSRAILEAHSPGTSRASRERAAETAIRIATDLGWTDHRRAFAHYVMGRLLQSTNTEAAQSQFLSADAFYARSYETQLHRAFVATQLAAYAIASNDPDKALRLIDPHIDAVTRAENASLLATLLMLKAEALELAGRTSEAGTVRLDSLGWARYGFGSDWAVRARLREIAALNPRKTAS